MDCHDSFEWLEEMEKLDNDNENDYNINFRMAKALEIIAKILISEVS